MGDFSHLARWFALLVIMVVTILSYRELQDIDAKLSVIANQQGPHP